MNKVDVTSKLKKRLQRENPVDYFNQTVTWDFVIKQVKELQPIGEFEYSTRQDIEFAIQEDIMHCIDDNDLDVEIGTTFTKFGLYAFTCFKDNWIACAAHIHYHFMKQDTPYVRVGSDFYKQIRKTDAWDNEYKYLAPWKKETIKDDYGAGYIKTIKKFDSFINEPNNLEFNQVIGDQYNVYLPMHWKPKEGELKWSKILMEHVFGDQIELGWKYMKCLFEHPKQLLPVLVLMSEDRSTGKTTFLNWLNMIYSSNFIEVSPDEIFASFNAGYANKLIIGMEEAFIDKQHGIEKIKKLATAKTLSVNQKFVNNYTVKFYGKLIITTNKEMDFMRIDDKEIRFWTRKLGTLKHLNTFIERDLMSEIPAFLHYLQTEVPEVDMSKSRMVFTASEIATEQLSVIKKESRSGLYKDLYEYLQWWFDNNQDFDEFPAAAKDIKEEWWTHNNQISVSYIRKVLKNEFKMETDKNQKYIPFEGKRKDGNSVEKVTGRPFIFRREDFDSPAFEDDEVPF